MSKAKPEKEIFICPVGRFLGELESVFDPKSGFWGHLKQSRIEFLKAIKCLVDDHIENLEKEKGKKRGKKMSRVEVE
jgi:hypothetical protein